MHVYLQGDKCDLVMSRLPLQYDVDSEATRDYSDMGIFQYFAWKNCRK